MFRKKQNFPPHIQNNVKCSPNCPERYQFRSSHPMDVRKEIAFVIEEERLAAEMMHSHWDQSNCRNLIFKKIALPVAEDARRKFGDLRRQ